MQPEPLKMKRSLEKAETSFSNVVNPSLTSSNVSESLPLIDLSVINEPELSSQQNPATVERIHADKRESIPSPNDQDTSMNNEANRQKVPGGPTVEAEKCKTTEEIRQYAMKKRKQKNSEKKKMLTSTNSIMSFFKPK